MITRILSMLECSRHQADDFDQRHYRNPEGQEWHEGERPQGRPPTRAGPITAIAADEGDNWYRDNWFSKQEQWQRDSGGGGGGYGGNDTFPARTGRSSSPEKVAGAGWRDRRMMMLHDGHLNRDDVIP